MIAYEELVVALTNWRIQQGLGTTGLQFNSQRSGRVNLDLPAADPDSLVEEFVSMDEVEVEEVEEMEMVDPSSLVAESAQDSALYDDGEHTSIAEAGSFSSSEESDPEAPPVLEDLDYSNDDTQYMEAPSSPDEVSVEASNDAQEGDLSDLVARDESAPEDSIESELAADDEPIDAGELEVEEIVEHDLVEEHGVIDAAGLEVEESEEASSVEVEQALVDEVDPSAVSEFDENESTQMGMGASLIRLAPGTADERVDNDSSNTAAQPDDE